jgi:ankyrin repeat protein
MKVLLLLYFFVNATYCDATTKNNKNLKLFDKANEDLFSYVISDNIANLKSALVKQLNKKTINKRYQDGDTLLMTAARKGNFSTIKILLEYGADPKIADIAQVTPLHIAAREGNTEIVKILLQYSADINAVDIDGFTPIMRAISFNNKDIVDILMQKNANLEIKNNFNITAQQMLKDSTLKNS